MAGGDPSQLNYHGGGTAGCTALVQPPRGASKLGTGMSAHNMERRDMVLRVLHFEEDLEIPVL